MKYWSDVVGFFAEMLLILWEPRQIQDFLPNELISPNEMTDFHQRRRSKWKSISAFLLPLCTCELWSSVGFSLARRRHLGLGTGDQSPETEDGRTPRFKKKGQQSVAETLLKWHRFLLNYHRPRTIVHFTTLPNQQSLAGTTQLQIRHAVHPPHAHPCPRPQRSYALNEATAQKNLPWVLVQAGWWWEHRNFRS